MLAALILIDELNFVFKAGLRKISEETAGDLSEPRPTSDKVRGSQRKFV